MADNRNGDVFTKLAQDIIFIILASLPAKSLLQLRCVCKYLNSLISDPYFLDLHLTAAPVSRRHHLVYYESTDYAKSSFSFHADQTLALCKTLDTPHPSVNGFIRLVGSSRGILCLFDTSYFNYVGTVTLWNPFIRKSKIIPSLPELRINLSHMVVGFGFNQCINDFRVVKILYDCGYEPEEPGFLSQVLVYDLRTGSWRMIIGQAAPCFVPKYWTSSVFVNGVVHWLAYKQPPKLNGKPDCIMGFDMINEVFKTIELPEKLGSKRGELRLSASADETSVALFVSYPENKWDLWVMSDYGDDDVKSWMRVFRVVLESDSFPLKIVKDGEILAVTRDRKLVSVDVEKYVFVDLEVYGLPTSFYVDGYIPSLALLCGV